MSRIATADLTDSLLQRFAGKYLADVEAWIVEQASDAGVAEADILATLGTRAKRAARYQLAIFTALGEGGQNQHAMGTDGKDAFSIKLKEYRDLQKELLPTLGAVDWSGSALSEDKTPSNICPRLFRA